MDLLKQTFDQMPEVFTSNEFGKQAIKNGFPKKMIKRNGLSRFLRKHADNLYSGSKTWTKKESTKNDNRITLEEEAVMMLKSLGYKVMKPVSDWIEC